MNIGLIAHDSKKALMQNFCIAYKGILSKHNLYATGKYSFEKISDILYKKGYKNKKGKAYSGTTLKKFLINPRYKGYYTANLTRVESYKTHKKINIPKDEQIIYKTDLIEPIVSEELWDKANQLHEARKRSSARHVLNTEKSLATAKYSCLMYCKHCGQRLDWDE